MSKNLELTNIDPDKVVPIGNYVLVKINIHNDRFKFANGIELLLDTSFSARHTSINCKVVKTPKRLIFNNDIEEGISMPHDTDCEVMAGDIVIVDFTAIYNCYNIYNSYFEADGETYFFIPYNQLIVAKRPWTKTDKDLFFSVNGRNFDPKEMELQNFIVEGNDIFTVIPLNGYVLVEPLPKDILSTLIIPDYLKKKKIMTMSKVVFSGTPNRAYYRDRYPSDCEVVNGQNIITETDCDIPLQADEHCDFYLDKRFWYIARANIIIGVPELKAMFEEVGIEGEIKVKV